MVRFFVKGVPRPKQSFKVSKRGKGYTPARIKAWQDTIGYAANPYFDGSPTPKKTAFYKVSLQFFLSDAVSRDLDNLSKAALDALNGIVWVDDDDVVDLHLKKAIRRANPGMVVKLEILEDYEPEVY